MPKKTREHVIAVVEDNQVLSEMIGDFLKDKFSNCRVQTFQSGESALNLPGFKPDVIVLDYHLDSSDPKALNGIQIMKMKEKFHAPVIFLTAQDRPEVAATMIKHGASDYIVKNQQSFGKLESSIRNLLQQGNAKPGKSAIIWIVLLVLAVLSLIIYFMS